MRRRRWRWWQGLVGALALLLVVGFAVSRFGNEPLRRRIEAGMNAALKGYKVRIRQARFHPIGLGIDLVDWVIVQEANPDPPVADIPLLHASVNWLALLHGGLVADFRFDRPTLHIDLRHAQKEVHDKTPVKERGWQEAALAIYPLKINLLRIVDGDFTYVEPGPLKPMHLSGIDFHAGNIRNVHSRAGVYPSDVHLRTKVFDTANLRVEGNADFLAEPYAAIKAAFDLDGVDVAYFEPLLHHYDIAVRRGTLATKGEIEYAPKVKTVRLFDTTLDGAEVEYVKRRSGQPTVGEKTAQAASQLTQQPSVAVRAERVKIARSKLSYANETADPPVRLFVTDCDLTLTNFSNVRDADPKGEPGKATVNAKFMDSGPTNASATFRPRADRTDFTIALRIDNTDVTTMNDLWRAYGKFDMEKGTFSLYSEIKVEEGRVDGYVKPIFADLKIVAPDEDKNVAHKVYEGIVAGVGKVLTNPPRDQIATETSLSGPLDNPKTSVLDVIGGLVRNAFFKAVLPGLKGLGSKG
jgi:hypothetical protein